MSSRVYEGEVAPADCPYRLEYTARRGFDLVPYLKLIELTVLAPDGTMVGHALWRHRGGFGFNKFARSRSKIEGAVDGLLGAR